MRIPPLMPETGCLETARRPTAFDREEILNRAFCGGFDMDILLERLFDTLTERRP